MTDSIKTPDINRIIRTHIGKSRSEKIFDIIATPDSVEFVDTNGVKSIIGRMGFSAKYLTIYDKFN